MDLNCRGPIETFAISADSERNTVLQLHNFEVGEHRLR